MYEDSVLNGEIKTGVISRCLCSLKDNKTGGNDGLVGELLQNNGSGMVDGKWSEAFSVAQGMAQGCSLFSVFINDLLKEIDQAELGLELSNGARIGGMVFTDDSVGVCDSPHDLQKLIDVVYAYCGKWRSFC